MTKDSRIDLPIIKKKPLQLPLHPGRNRCLQDHVPDHRNTPDTSTSFDLVDVHLPKQSQRSRKAFPEYRFRSTNISSIWLIHKQRRYAITLAYLGPRGAQYSPVVLMSKSAMNLMRDLAASSGVTANQNTVCFSGCATRGFHTSRRHPRIYHN